MYDPDRGFMKKLKALDPNLGCKYFIEHGHFVITYRRAIGEPVPVWLVKNDNGGFRHPDDRDILKLQEGDIHRVPVKDRLRQLSKYMEDDRAIRAMKRKQEIRDMTKDSKIQLSKKLAKVDSAMTGAKENYHFRRINLRPKGKVISSSPVANQP
jgi:hypothetical protein